MKIKILKKELVNLESEFEFFSNVIDKYKSDFENMRRSNRTTWEHPSRNIIKIIQLLEHKTERATGLFNHLLAVCEEESTSGRSYSEQNPMVFAEILEEFAQYFDSVVRKANSLKLKLEEMKQKAHFGGRNRQARSRDQVFRYGNEGEMHSARQGFGHLDGILGDFEQ